MPRSKRQEKNGPGLLFIVITLVVVAVVGARFFGFMPEGSKQEQPPLAPGVDDSQPPGLLGSPQVLIYHSYATGNYSPSEQSHRRGGEPGDIVAVGTELTLALERLEVKAIQDTTVHDKPHFSEAFISSGKMVAAALEQNSEIKMVLDIARDGLQDKPENYTTAKVNGIDVAKILFVVGGKDNPHLDRNLAFAHQLSDALEKKYPGVTRGVRVFDMDYNGKLHPHMIRIMIGDWQGNTAAQARESAKLLAEIIAPLVK